MNTPPHSWMTRRFLLYAAGNSINNVGNSMWTIALPLLVYHLTRSSLSMGITVAVEALSMLFQPLVGTWVDHTSPRLLLIGSLTYQAVVSAFVPLLYDVHALTVGVIYAVVFLLGLGMNAVQTVQTVLIPLMFPALKDRASAGLTTAYTLTTIVGPFVAGVVLGTSGYLALFWLNALSFLAPVVLLPWTQVPDRRHGASQSEESGWWERTQEGWRALRQYPMTRNLLVVLMALRLSNAAMLPLVEFVLKHRFGLSSALVSGVFVVDGLGSFLGTRVPVQWHPASPKTMFIAMGGLNVVGLLCLWVPRWPAIPVGLFLVAVGYLGAAVTRNLLLQNAFPVGMLGRISTTFRTMTGMSGIAAPLVVGAITTAWGPAWAVAVLVAAAAVSLGYVVAPHVPSKPDAA